MSRQKENTMKRITFAWVLALAAAVFGLIAFTTAPALALDTGPNVAASLDSVVDVVDQALIANLSVDQIDQDAANILSSTDAGDIATANVAGDVNDTDDPETVRLWLDPGRGDVLVANVLDQPAQELTRPPNLG